MDKWMNCYIFFIFLMLLVNQFVGFFNEEYVPEEMIDFSDFSYGDRHSGKKKIETNLSETAGDFRVPDLLMEAK